MREQWAMVLLWDIYRVVLGILGSVLVIVGMKAVENSKLVAKTMPAVKFFSIHSMGIYMISTYVNIVLLKVTAGFSYHIGVVLLETVATLVLCFWEERKTDE